MQALNAHGLRSETIRFANVMTSIDTVLLSHRVMEYVITACISQGDLARGYMLLDCLRKGLLLNKGVLDYIEQSELTYNMNDISLPDMTSPLLHKVNEAKRSKCDIVLSKMSSDAKNMPSLYCNMLKRVPDSIRKDKIAYSEHIKRIFLRMSYDNHHISLQLLFSILVINLGAGATIVTTTRCYQWLDKMLQSKGLNR